MLFFLQYLQPVRAYFSLLYLSMVTFQMLASNLSAQKDQRGSSAVEGVGEFQFRRLEKKLSTLPTLWLQQCIDSQTFTFSLNLQQLLKGLWPINRTWTCRATWSRACRPPCSPTVRWAASASPTTPSLPFNPSNSAVSQTFCILVSYSIFYWVLTGGIFWICILTLFNTAHLPPFRFHCVGGYWDRIQDCCDFGKASQTL